ncbi:MAG TPA: AraC family transcriptional regulator [Blastocatellia bacterium]
MINRFRVSSLLPNRLEELGVSPLAVLRQAGLPMGLFNQEKVFVTTGELFGLWRGIAEVSRDPAIGLKLGSEERIERYSPIAIAALYTRSFRDALQRLARYKQLTCPEEIRLIERKGECAVLFKWLLAREPEPEALVDICFACVVSIGRRGAGQSTNPMRVELKRTASHRQLFEEYFQCPVKFDAGHNALIYNAADIDRPFLTHNPELLAIVAPQLEAELAYQIAQQTVPGQVKAILKRLLAGRRPAVQDVARELRLSPRTLQRRLTEEGLTFQQLLEDARRELARHYLLHSSLELNETAYLLGYEDPNSFFRAFQHWEGATPGQWRTIHKDGGQFVS